MRKKIVLLSLVMVCVFNKVIVSAAEENVNENISTLLKTNSCIGCNLKGADLIRAKLKGASLRNSILDGARFCLANLSGADFEKASLRKVEFCGADISGANFIDADLTDTSFVGVYSRGAIYQRIEEKAKATEDRSIGKSGVTFTDNIEEHQGLIKNITPIVILKAPDKKIIYKIEPIKNIQ